MGAWIETPTPILSFVEMVVAPYVGAWIETYLQMSLVDRYLVAPYVGAWIETSTSFVAGGALTGRTLRGCVD